MVAYRDGLALFDWGKDSNADLIGEHRGELSAICSLGSRWLLANSRTVSVLDSEFRVLQQVSHGQTEDIVNVIPTGEEGFLLVDELSRVTRWALADGKVDCVGPWMVECTPLFALSPATTLCSEQGRLQERDTKTGMLLKTWADKTPVYWAVRDGAGHHALTIDEAGRASIWEIGSRERLFGIDCPFPVSRALFLESGLKGVLLGSEGEVAEFSLAQGGSATVWVTPESLCALGRNSDRILGLDDSGSVWSLERESFAEIASHWAGWATATTDWKQQIWVGTACGKVLGFGASDQDNFSATLKHRETVVGVEGCARGLLSLAADASVHLHQLCDDQLDSTVLLKPEGRTLIGYVVDHQTSHLHMALDQGSLLSLPLNRPETRSEYQLEDKRIEEIRLCSQGLLVLTDRGTVSLLSLPE